MPGGWDKNVIMSEKEETAPHGLGDWHNLLWRIVQIRPVSLQTHLWPRKLNFCRIQKKAFAFLVYYYVSLLLLRVCAMTRDAYHTVAAKKWLSAKRWFPVFTKKRDFPYLNCCRGLVGLYAKYMSNVSLMNDCKSLEPQTPLLSQGRSTFWWRGFYISYIYIYISS